MKQQVRIGLALLAFATFAVVAPFNHEPVIFHLWGGRQWSLPLAFMLAISFVGGAIITLGYVYLGKAAGALDRRIFEWEPRSRRKALALVKRGREAMNLGDEQKAYKFFTMAIRRDERCAQAHLALAQWYLARNNAKEALVQARKATALAPDDKTAMETLAKAAKLSGETTRAADTLLQLSEAEPKSKKVLKELPITLADAGRWEEALEAQKKLMNELPKEARQSENTNLWGIMTEYARSIKEVDTEKAIKLLKEVVKDAPDFTPAVLLLAEIYASKGDTKRANKVLTRAFELSGNSIIFENAMRLLPDIKKEFEQTAMTLLAKEPRNNSLRFALAKYLLRENRAEEALNEMEKISVHTDTAYALLKLIILRRLKNDSIENVENEILEDWENSYLCDVCNEKVDRWHPRCPKCASWNTIRISV
jgi:tetratricopeptide (TPR) repeat protein